MPIAQLPNSNMRTCCWSSRCTDHDHRMRIGLVGRSDPARPRSMTCSPQSHPTTTTAAVAAADALVGNRPCTPPRSRAPRGGGGRTAAGNTRHRVPDRRRRRTCESASRLFPTGNTLRNLQRKQATRRDAQVLGRRSMIMSHFVLSLSLSLSHQDQIASSSWAAARGSLGEVHPCSR